jgi:hypothetical protein
MAQFIQNSFTQDPAIGVAGARAYVRHSDKIRSGVHAKHKQISVAVTAVNSTLYTVTLNGVVFQFTSDASATTVEITAGLRDAINAGSEPVRASGSDTPLIVDAAVDGNDFTHAVGANLVATVTAAGQEIPVGVGVCMDETNTEEQAVRLPAASGDVTGFRFVGVVLNDLAKVAYAGSLGVRNVQYYHQNTELPILENGVVYVTVEEAVAKGDQAFCRYASGAGGSQLGAFRKSADTATAAALPRCCFESDAVAGGLAKLRVQL